MNKSSSTPNFGLNSTLFRTLSAPLTTCVRALLWSFCLTAIVSCSHESSPQNLHSSQTINTLSRIMDSGVLRIVTRYNPTTYYEDHQGSNGFEYALASEFAKSLGVKLEVTVATSIQEIFDTLETGDADIAAAGLTITKERGEQLSFSNSYLQTHQQVIYRAGKKRPRNFSQITGQLMVMADSTHASTLSQAQQAIPSLQWQETTKADTIELMSLIQKDQLDYTLIDANEFLTYHGLFPRLRVAFNLKQQEQFGWATAKHERNDDLLETLNAFFEETEKNGGMERLKESFYGHSQSINQASMHTFAKNKRKRLPRYEQLIKEIAKEFDIDWHLLAAIGYQESHWNPKAVSPTGVRGLMMLTRTTARELNVSDRTDPEQSLRGGAQYFTNMLIRLPKTINEQDKVWFALAAYNVGMGHLRDARKLTRLQGGNQNRWADVAEHLPLLQQKEWHQQTRYGYARGEEPVSYVKNIRQYYHVLALSEVAKSLPNTGIELASLISEETLTAATIL